MSSNIASVHLVGNVVKDPETIFHAEEKERGLVSVRMAVNNRYLSNEGQWTDGDTTYVEVQCWNKLGANVSYSIRKGMPIIVIGRLVQSTWEATADDGSTQRRSVLRVKASHVGPDLNNRMARTFKSPTEQDAEQHDKHVEQSASRDTPEVTESADNAGLVAVGADAPPAF